ncbi:RNA polymerase sigma factor [Pedobacter steynii]|uniref:RNA polymerase sigma-70 factor, ECF subfamily n=1 Tax=Pedobacter steynii TaxID=430522 RepID=A0A1D7QN78_9SPHI|nr:RNA polymerase sigma-70 factor [Pedobacter steynii]AOM80103.1 hypothetical protein BFS30_24830 [Pedobacter steynii]
MEHLWHLVQKGDATAFGDIYDLHWETIYHTIYWRVCDEDIAKDLLQDIFISLWEKRESILITGSIEAYLRVMARNRVINHFKSESIRQGHTNAAGYHLPSSTYSTEELLAAKEMNEHYQRSITQLPEKMREIYILSREKGLDIEQISLHLSLSPQTVKNQLTAATKKIRAVLAPFMQNPDTDSRRFAIFFFVCA